MLGKTGFGRSNPKTASSVKMIFGNGIPDDRSHGSIIQASRGSKVALSGITLWVLGCGLMNESANCRTRRAKSISETYRTVEHILSLIPSFFDMTFERTRVQRLEQFKATQQLCRNRHDGPPIVELAAILLQ